MSLGQQDYFRLISFEKTTDLGKALKTKSKLPFCRGHLHLKRKFPSVRVSPLSTGKRRVTESLETLINGEGSNLNLHNSGSLT